MLLTQVAGTEHDGEPLDMDAAAKAVVESLPYPVLRAWANESLRRNPVVYRRSPWRPVCGLLTAAGMIAVAVWLGTLPRLADSAAVFVVLPLAALGLVLIVSSIVLALDTSPKLRLDYEGLTDLRAKNRRMIRWEEIAKARYYERSRNGSCECAVIFVTLRSSTVLPEVEINVQGLNASPHAIFGEVVRRADLW